MAVTLGTIPKASDTLGPHSIGNVEEGALVRTPLTSLISSPASSAAARIALTL